MPQLVQAAKKLLSQRIQHVDDKLEQQKEISVQIRDQVLWNSVSFAWKRTPDVFMFIETARTDLETYVPLWS